MLREVNIRFRIAVQPHNSTPGPYRLMYNYGKSASELCSLAQRGSSKIGVLGIPGRIRTVFVQQIWRSMPFLKTWHSQNQ